MKTAWFGVLGLALLGGKVDAARPLIVDDAEPVEYKHFQIQAGLDYSGNSEVRDLGATDSLAYGVLPRLELGVGTGWLWERRIEEFGRDENVNGITDLVFAGKWKMLDQEKFLADQTLGFALVVPTASEDKSLGTGQVDGALTWIVTRKIADDLQVDLNVGYTFRGDPDDENLPDLVRYGFAVEYLLTEHLQPVAEIFGKTPVGESGDTAFLVNAGIRWLVAEGLTLDGAIGTGIRGEAPDVFATAGLTWVF